MNVVYMQPSLSTQLYVTVFRTNVSDKAIAQLIKMHLAIKFPDCYFHFDLSDCDRVFRVESTTDIGTEIRLIFSKYGFICELLQ